MTSVGAPKLQRARECLANSLNKSATYSPKAKPLFTRSMTVSELRKLLETGSAKKDIRINIRSLDGSYPNIRVTLPPCVVPKERRYKPRPPPPKLTNLPTTQTRRLPSADPGPVPLTNILSSLSAKKLTPTDLVKNWLDSNPVEREFHPESS